MKTKSKNRIAIGTCFFLTGICFSSWASRIPTIKDFFNLNEAALGNLLMVMPITALIGLPVSGWLVSKFNTRHPMLFSFFFFAAALVLIGFASSQIELIAGIFIFSFSLRLINVAMNTQAINLQKQYHKKINGAFHGYWSLGGITGLLIATAMVKFNVPMAIHLSIIGGFTFITILGAYPYFLKNDRPKSGNKLNLKNPEKQVVYLGLIVLFAAICEGGIYDWNGVYFKEVINVELFTTGYLSFMICMTISRFYSDKLIEKIGIEKTFFLSASLIVLGIGCAVIFPVFWVALFGFCITGLGVSTLFPMSFSLAGESKKYAPGIIISILSTYSIVGMLAGPPLIGYLAYILGLRASFVIFILCGLLFIPLSKLYFSAVKK